MAYTNKQIENLFNKILLEIEEGRAIRNILIPKDMPDAVTFYKWIDKDKDKFKRYARACEARADAMVEDMIKIADDGLNDTYKDSEGNVRVDHDVIARSKLRVDTRKWLASKLKPKKYGDSQQIKFADSEGEQLKMVSIFPDIIFNVPKDESTREDS